MIRPRYPKATLDRLNKGLAEGSITPTEFTRELKRTNLPRSFIGTPKDRQYFAPSIRALLTREPMTVEVIADRIGVTRRQTLVALTRLVDRGEVKRIGSKYTLRRKAA